MSTTIKISRTIPMDAQMRIGWRESQKLVPNWRFAAVTGGIELLADVHPGGYCFVPVGRFPETLSSVSP